MAVKALSQPRGGDRLIRVGAAGACGLGALFAICGQKELEPVLAASGLGAQSQVLVICTEGVTNPVSYEEMPTTGLNAYK